jgi:hypothetical protein
MEGYLVGLADFKSVVSRQQSGQVGSIPTHSRYFLAWIIHRVAKLQKKHSTPSHKAGIRHGGHTKKKR